MTLENKTKGNIVAKKIIQTAKNGELLESVGLCARRKKIWVTALQESRGDEQKAEGLYSDYMSQAIKDEAEIAKALLEECPTAIIQGYTSKMEHGQREKKKKTHNMPSNLMPRKYRRKECYKCRQVVPLELKKCPKCNYNSFVFFS